MKTTTLKKHYKEHIREVNGFIHKNDTVSPIKKRKQWRINQDHIRHSFIDTYIQSGLYPSYLVTVSYYYDENDRVKVEENNQRINRVINDFFNRYNRSGNEIFVDHFIERFEDKLDDKVENKSFVLNTVTNEYDFDWTNREVIKGSFHTHHLVSYIPDEVIKEPDKRVMNAIDNVYGGNGLPFHLRSEDRIEEVKCDLLEYTLRKRCNHFIGNGEQSLDVKPVDVHRGYDGYSGWKGAVAYVTKQMYNVDKMLEVYDYHNSNILKGV